MQIVIAGAGIGGLTLAGALRSSGHGVIVVERAQELRPVGAGITVQANAMKAFATLGLADEVAKEGEAVTAMQILRPNGTVLSEVPVDRVVAALGAPVICLLRARLHAALLRHAGEAVVRFGSGISRYRETTEAVEVELEGGESMDCHLLVGADGLHSVVRQGVVGDTPLRYSGYTSWRGVSDDASGRAPGVVSETWGRGLRFGIVPIGHGQIYWYAVANAPAGGRDSATHSGLLSRFAGWHAPIQRLLETTPENALLRTDVYDRAPLSQWSKGRVVLLGDAAHPMTPNLGQGGCQAIEDAVVLARLIRADYPAAFSEYEHARVARANGIVERARFIGRFAQWANPVAVGIRDLLLQMTPRSVTERQLLEAMRFAPPSRPCVEPMESATG